jgi:hypothetical protein
MRWAHRRRGGAVSSGVGPIVGSVGDVGVYEGMVVGVVVRVVEGAWVG